MKLRIIRLFILPSFLCSTSVLADGQQFNVLFIMSDDHTSQAIGAYGGRLAELNPTPTIDELAALGSTMCSLRMRFVRPVVLRSSQDNTVRRTAFWISMVKLPSMTSTYLV